MALFGKPNLQDAARQERNRRSQEQLERGGLPADAEDRLRELHSNPTFFTSNLSINEFVLAADDGLRPLGQVMGSSIYHIGWQYQPYYTSSELATLSHAQYHARLLALSRLQQEAKLLGAHGVIGVRLERQAYEWGDNLLEFTARGTAIALDQGEVPAMPFVCALSGQDFWTLRRAGYKPVGFAFGTCVWYHVASYSNQWVSQSNFWGGAGMMNMELGDFTQGTYEARHLAMSRMTDEANRVAADGIVGVTIENALRLQEVDLGNDQTRRDLIVYFTALGTAITEQHNHWPVIDYALPLSQ